MQVQGRRGRACQSCRRRKIKCGEQTPACQQCITSKLECSGPVTGPIIVEVNPQRGRRQYRQGGGSRNPGRDRDKDAPRRDPAPSASAAQASGEGSLSGQESPSIDEVPDQRVILSALATKFQECVWIPHQRQDSVVAYFVEFSAFGQFPTLQRSIGAVSLAMTGIATENWALLREAQRLYGATLNALIRGLPGRSGQELAAGATQQDQRISIEFMVLSVVCVWYEAIGCTANPNGWIEHTWGAGRLVLTRPPGDYTNGIAHALFRTARYMVANTSLAAIEPTPFALDTWLNIPFSSSPKNPFDFLVDFMLVIPVCLSLVHRLRANGTSIPDSVEVETVRQKLLQLNQQLDRWWIEYQEKFARQGQRVWIDIEDDFEDASGVYHPAKRQFQTEAAIECTAHYATNRLIVALISANLAPPSDQPCFRTQALTYSALTISATATAVAHSATGRLREYFGLIVQMALVYCTTPSKSHQAYVKETIHTWADPYGFRGICGVEETMVGRWRSLTAIWGDLI